MKKEYKLNQFRNLKIRHKSMEICVEVYELMKSYPAMEKDALAIQTNRSAVSVPSNIAEGAGRNSYKKFRNFIGIAGGSSCELITQRIIANRLQYISDLQLKSIEQKMGEVQKMMSSFQNHLNTFCEPGLPVHLKN